MLQSNQDALVRDSITYFGLFRGSEWLNHMIINLFFTLYICPVTLVIFFQRMPTDRNAKIIYTAVWLTFHTIIQALFAHKGKHMEMYGIAGRIFGYMLHCFNSSKKPSEYLWKSFA